MKQPIKKRIAEANSLETNKQVFTLLVDGSNLMKIALVDKRMNQDGKEYGAVFMFLKMLGDILKKKDFDYCCVCFDSEGSGLLRYRIYRDYKANRDKNYASIDSESEYDKSMREFAKAVISHSRNKNSERKGSSYSESDEECYERQKAIISSILEELCIRQYEYDNVEGDDIIAYYVKNKLENEKIVIVSSDRDLTQLIREDVIIYNPRDKDFINTKNSVEKIGVRYDNVAIMKILCGDASDNIKGVKGLGEKTLVTQIPEIREKKMTLDEVIETSKSILEERKASKKKPLKALENLVEGITDGCQGDRLYEINKAIIELSEPMLTDDAKASLDDEMRCVMDTSDRDFKNVYAIINENKMSDLNDETKFGDVFSPYSRIIMMEKRRYDLFKRGD